MKLEHAIKALLVLTAVAGFVFLLSLNLPRGKGKLSIAGGVIVLAGLWYLTDHVSNKSRRKELATVLSQLGIKAAEDGRYLHRPIKGQSACNVQLAAEGLRNDRPLHIVEFTFTTGSGKHRVTHYRTQVSRPCPPSWPALSIQKRRGFASRPLSQLFHSPRAGLENAGFEKYWEVTCDNKDFMLLILTPQVQQWIAGSKRDQEWLIGDSMVCLSHHRKCRAEHISGLIERFEHFMSLLPVELESW